MISIWLIAKIIPGEMTHKLDFMSRGQTWIPLFALITGAFVGLIDDYMEIKGIAGWPSGGLLIMQNPNRWMLKSQNDRLTPLLPTHFKCPGTGAVLPVENPSVWILHDQEVQS
jgi:hypothetical protein